MGLLFHLSSRLKSNNLGKTTHRTCLERKMFSLMDILFNFPLWAALFGVFFAQFLKVPIYFIATKQIDWSLFNATGGMPSSHSAATTALATGVALEAGLDSPVFAVAAMFSIIVMFDSTGVRRQTGEQAIVLNQLVLNFNRFFSEAKNWQQKQEREKIEELKELLGHKPIEVLVGGLLGILSTLILYYAFQIA